MITKLPPSILVTDYDELSHVLEKRKRKMVILFVDMRKFGMTREEQLRMSEKVQALKNTSRYLYNRKPKDLIMFINEKYSERKRLV